MSLSTRSRLLCRASHCLTIRGAQFPGFASDDSQFTPSWSAESTSPHIYFRWPSTSRATLISEVWRRVPPRLILVTTRSRRASSMLSLKNRQRLRPLRYRGVHPKARASSRTVVAALLPHPAVRPRRTTRVNAKSEGGWKSERPESGV